MDSVKEIIYEHYGTIVQIAAKMGCSPKAVYDAIDCEPELAQAVEDARAVKKEITLDLSELTVEKTMERIEADGTNALRAARYYLETHGAKRGYVKDAVGGGECPAAKAAAAEAAAKGAQ
ncbi:MAG: hypothetical protein U1C66_00065 [Patescibacteria group bacterium]|nr:hypothetical protein [Patescibacteria group bacterium]